MRKKTALLEKNRLVRCMEKGASGNSSVKGKVKAGQVVLHVAVHLSQSPAFVSEEWLVLDSTPLIALRDSMYCVMDENMKNVEREFNKTSEQEGDPKEALVDRRAYFYMEGHFFEDRRCEPENEISAPILEFLRYVSMVQRYMIVGIAFEPKDWNVDNYDDEIMQKK